MDFALYPVLEALLLTVALSTDAFVASFAYGANRIRIPPASVAVISLVCSLILAVSLLAGSVLRPFLPGTALRAVSFAILFLLGVAKLFDSSIKALIRRHNGIHKDIRFSFSRLRFILSVYADPEEADLDSSRILSVPEAASLAVALSLDGLAVGFGAGLQSSRPGLVAVFSLLAGFLAVTLGGRLGNKAAQRVPLDLSWLSGVLLIVLATLRI